jgi:hypothetical protein
MKNSNIRFKLEVGRFLDTISRVLNNRCFFSFSDDLADFGVLFHDF